MTFGVEFAFKTVTGVALGITDDDAPERTCEVWAGTGVNDYFDFLRESKGTDEAVREIRETIDPVDTLLRVIWDGAVGRWWVDDVFEDVKRRVMESENPASLFIPINSSAGKRP